MEVIRAPACALTSSNLHVSVAVPAASGFSHLNLLKVLVPSRGTTCGDGRVVTVTGGRYCNCWQYLATDLHAAVWASRCLPQQRQHSHLTQMTQQPYLGIAQVSSMDAGDRKSSIDKACSRLLAGPPQVNSPSLWLK